MKKNWISLLFFILVLLMPSCTTPEVGDVVVLAGNRNSLEVNPEDYGEEAGFYSHKSNNCTLRQEGADIVVVKKSNTGIIQVRQFVGFVDEEILQVGEDGIVQIATEEREFYCVGWVAPRLVKVKK